MRDMTEAELQKRCENDGSFALFVYTPLCGTCAVGERMLEILLVMRPWFSISKANVNRMPQFVGRWQIESVPCLLHIENGMVKRKLYAFQSVENVLLFLQPLFPNETPKG